MRKRTAKTGHLLLAVRVTTDKYANRSEKEVEPARKRLPRDALMP